MMKAAILGTGFIAEFHAVGYAALEDVQLCAVCDIDVEKAKALAEKFRCAWYESAEELLEKEKPDLVSICLPNFLHAQYGCLAMQSGAHVLCVRKTAGDDDGGMPCAGGNIPGDRKAHHDGAGAALLAGVYRDREGDPPYGHSAVHAGAAFSASDAGRRLARG